MRQLLLVLENGAHEGPLIPDYATTVVPNAVSLDEFPIDTEMAPVLLILREAWKAEERQGTVARTFRRQKIPMMSAAVAVDQVDPVLEPWRAYGPRRGFIKSPAIRGARDDATGDLAPPASGVLEMQIDICNIGMECFSMMEESSYTGSS